MITRSFDLDLLLKLTKPYEAIAPQEDFIKWFNMPSNLMFVEGDNVGLATYEYPGVYGVHWYFTCRGREAIELAKRMIKNLFENYDAITIRGMVKENLRASRWATRQVGLKSYGMVDDPKFGRNEMFITTKEEFLGKVNKWAA